MHVCGDVYMSELLARWLDLEHTALPVAHRQTGEPYNHVWRGITRR